MQEQSTILLEKRTINLLKKVKEYSRQTYNELIHKMIIAYKEMKKKNQYDEFLHRIQQTKMKALWSNKEDEEWENA